MTRRRQQLARRARSRKLLLESLEKRMVLASSPWHNEFDRFDVLPAAGARKPADGLIALTNFVAASEGKPVAVPPMPHPDPAAHNYFDIDNNRVVDRFDLSDLVRHLAATADAPLPPGPMGPLMLETEFAEGEGGSSGSSGSSGPPTPTVYLTSNASYLMENGPALDAFCFGRTSGEGSLTVYFTVGSASTASPSDWQSPILASGQVTFVPDQTTFYVPVLALEDALLENFETLVVNLLPHSSYNMGSNIAETTLHDGEHGIIDTGFSVELEDETSWIGAEDVLWEGVNHRWRANIPSGLVGQIGQITWYSRQYGNPLAPWESFAGSTFSGSSQAIDYVVEGLPDVGHREIMYKATYGLLSHFQAASRIKPIARIDHVEWKGIEVAGATNVVEEAGGGVRFFPEKNRFDHDDDDDTHTKVLFKVFVTPNMLGLNVSVMAFDPDDPSASTNPIDNDGAGGSSTDNRGPTTHLEGEPTTIQTSSVEGELAVAEIEFTPTKAIGDNFRIVAAGSPRGLSTTRIKAVVSNSPPETRARLVWDDGPGGKTPVILDSGGPFVIPGNSLHVSTLLTIWRTLWVEVDSMPDPTGIWFEDDDLLGFMPPPVTSGFGPAFAEMFIDAKMLPAEFNVKKPVTDDDPETPGFLREFGTQAQLKAYFLDDPNGVRDTKDESDHYWTVYVASIYEIGPANAAAPGNDNDLDPEFGMMGWTYQDGQDIEVSLVAMEVVRDLATQNEPHWETTPDAPGRLIPIVTLHEVGHQFLGDGHHDGDYPSFVMAVRPTDVDERRIPEMQLRFSPGHIAEIRQEYKSGKHP